MSKHTIVGLFFVLTLLGTQQAEAASPKRKALKKNVRRVIIQKPVKKPVKKVAPKTSYKQPATVLSQSTSPGSDPSPSPTVVKNVSSQPTLKFEGCAQTNFNEEFLCLINKYRAQNGKTNLSYDPALNTVSQNYSTYMKNSNFFSHVGPDGSHYHERCVSQGTTCHGENLAKGFLSAQSLFDMWRNSPGHNQNILGPYTTMGLGTSGNYATNIFRW